jgi:hypothetical protein
MIEHNGRNYITSKEWHEQVKPMARTSETNRAIRGMETYGTLLADGHIIELTKDDASADLALLVISNGYNPVMLIDAVAQKAIEHHFQQTASNAIQSSKESAALGLAGIRFDLIAQDTQVMLLLQTLSKQKELENKQKELEQLVPKLIDEAAQKMAGQAGYYTVLAYASLTSHRLDSSKAGKLGKAASQLCRDLGYDIGSASDVRFGKVNAYPQEVLQVVFSEEAM